MGKFEDELARAAHIERATEAHVQTKFNMNQIFDGLAVLAEAAALGSVDENNGDEPRDNVGIAAILNGSTQDRLRNMNAPAYFQALGLAYRAGRVYARECMRREAELARKQADRKAKQDEQDSRKGSVLIPSFIVVSKVEGDEGR